MAERPVIARCERCGMYWFSRVRARCDAHAHRMYCGGYVRWKRGLVQTSGSVPGEADG